jgi:hypothetical protein
MEGDGRDLLAEVQRLRAAEAGLRSAAQRLVDALPHMLMQPRSQRTLAQIQEYHDAKKALRSALAQGVSPEPSHIEPWCARCSGTGWTEGGATLKTPCPDCGAQGVSHQEGAQP